MHEFLQEKLLKILYNAFINLYTVYGILAWQGAPRTHLNKVSRSLKNSIKVMLFKNKYELTKALFEYSSIVPFDINVKLQQGNFIKQLSLDLQPESITKHFPLRCIDSINSINSDNLIIPYRMTTVGVVSSLFYQGFKKCNEIPKKLKQIQFIKKTTDNTLLNKCSGKQYVNLRV